MSDSTWGYAILTVIVGSIVGSGLVITVLIQRRLPPGICRRLLRGSGPITIHTTESGGAWNPAKPRGKSNATPNEPGIAVYSLAEDGMVRLDLTRYGGKIEHYVGPLVYPSDTDTQIRRIGWIPVFTYAVGASAGFVIGFAVNTGASHRIGAGLMGAVIGCVAAYIGLIAMRMRMTRQQPPEQVDI